MRRHRRRNPVAAALWVNALVLGAILVVLITRSNSPGMIPFAFGADEQSRIPLAPQPIAGGGGIFLMPAQFAVNQWGCYIMDIDRQTLCAYEYSPAEKNLRLVAARNFTYDRQLKNFNTGSNPGEMSPGEVRKIVEKEQQDERVKGAADTTPAPDAQQNPQPDKQQ
jgi:hypothetical protein